MAKRGIKRNRRKQSTTNLKVVIRPSTQFSRYADQWAQTIPNINITNTGGDIWVEKVYGFVPGDSAYVDADTITEMQTGVVSSGLTSSTGNQMINHASNIGKTFDIELYDASSNTLIAKTSTIIRA